VPKNTAEYILAEALATDCLTGAPVENAIAHVFYSNFVQNDEGLSYIHKFAPEAVANHARRRLNEEFSHPSFCEDDDVRRAIRGIEEAHSGMYETDGKKTPDSTYFFIELGSQACRRIKLGDDNLRDAVEALLELNEEDDKIEEQIRRIVRAGTNHHDRVRAAVASYCNDDYPMLGLRACQRLITDGDSAFREGLYDLVTPDPDQAPSRSTILTYLKAQFKGRKL
jgi:hypothetical protein